MHIPVLMYHEIISDNPHEELTKKIQGSYLVNSKSFKDQMAYLKESGYTTVTPLEAAKILKTKKEAKSKPVVITFDDGYEGNYLYALPALKEHGFSATFFISSGQVGKPCMMSWNQIREMNDQGMTIGSHCVSHPILSSLTLNDVEIELTESRRILEKEIGTTVHSFSYPNGDYNSKILTIVKKSGYKTACSSDFGMNNKRINLFRIKRLKVPGHYTLSDFAKLLSFDRKIFYLLETKYFFLSLVKGLIGPNNYEKVYSKIFNITS